jgi:hypothetical protein
MSRVPGPELKTLERTTTRSPPRRYRKSAPKTPEELKGLPLSTVSVCFHLVGHAPQTPHRHRHQNRGRPRAIARCFVARNVFGKLHLRRTFLCHLRRPKKRMWAKEVP